MTHYRITDLPQRLQGRIELSPGGCWIWTGAASRDGYGMARFDGKQNYTHRIAYRLFVGEIPAGYHVDHLCRVRSCCNPVHLEAVTPRENLLRAPNTVAARNRAKTHCPKGHPYDEANTTISSRATGSFRKCKACHCETMRRNRAASKARVAA